MVCAKGWLKSCMAEKHFTECDKDHKKQHIKICEGLKDKGVEQVIEMTEASSESIDKSVKPLVEELSKMREENEKLTKKMKKMQQDYEILETQLEENAQHAVMFKRLVWGLIERYDKDERRELMELLETIPANEKYPDMDWEGELLVNHNKSAVFPNDMPDEE
jgi:predicted RNase H-like nuclease (RuvC/YqgF family)